MASTTSRAATGAPIPGPVKSIWTNSPQPLDDHRTTPELSNTADVVIVGAGFAGIATAYHILKDNPDPPSVVVLEARQICSGATGRNGGHVKPDTYYNVSRNAEMYGIEAAAEVAAFESAHVYAVKELVEREGLDCDFHLTRAVDVYLNAEHAKKTEAAYRELVELGVVDLDDVQFVSREDAERVSGVKGALCCFTFTAAHLWPSKLVHQLAQKMIDKGLNVQANTPVTSVSKSSKSGKWTVATPRGDIETAKVIYATNGYTQTLLPEYSGVIVPVRGICSHISSPKKASTPHLVNTYGIRFDARNNDYLIPRADGSIVVGGARQRFWHKRDRWFGNVRDDELVDEAVSYFDGYTQRHFRGWEESEAETSKVWTGIMGYSSDFMPHLGAVPDKPGQFIIAGFSGHGMPEILLSSKGLAKMVRDGDDFADSGLPRLFETSNMRLQKSPSPLEESLRPLWGGAHRAKL